MPIRAPNAAEPREDPLSPGGGRPLMFENWRGVNTSTTRGGVPDDQAYWLDGFIPLADRNLRTLWGIGSAIYTASGTTVVAFYFANIGSTPYCIVFLANGAVVAVNTTTLAATTVLAAATITSPTILTVGITQWGSEYIIIVAQQTDGYWVWNGSLVFKSGTIGPIVTVTNGGGGYTLTPTVLLSGGHGSGTSLVAIMSNNQVSSISVVAPGSGYIATDVVAVNFVGAPSGGSGASLTGSLTAGTLNSISIVSGGSLYSSNPTITFTIGPSESAKPTALAIVTGGTIAGTSITSRGAGITGITIGIVDAPVTASASVQLMPYGVSGTWAETYNQMVWVIDGTSLIWSAPGSFQDFSTSNGGGRDSSPDSFLRSRYVSLLSVNGFLFVIGDSSINYISGVTTSGSPPTTTFTNQNADAQVGTPFPASVAAFGRNIMFANAFGIHSMSGGAATKVSGMLDGVYNTVAVPSNGFSFGIQLSSAQAIIFGRKCWMTLVRVVDPITGTTENKLMMTDAAQARGGDMKWWASLQNLSLTFIRHQEIDSIITAYGTNGTVIHPLFQTATVGFTKRAQGKLYDRPGVQFTKASQDLFLAAQYYSTLSPNLIVSVDNQRGTMATQYTITGPSSIGLTVVPPQGVGQVGEFTGLTITTVAADVALVTASLQEQIVGYRGR